MVVSAMPKARPRTGKGFWSMKHDPRDRFRAHALDGALHFFHPRSGTHVRFQGPRTARMRRTAPRVVMFGITNECRLSCAFCSRDKRRESLWTADSAFEVLRDLAAEGVLEVAFGGGEPFEFPQFPELITRLHDQTPLALHVTTNGTVLDRFTWPPFIGRFGQVRVSLYGDTTWRRCAELFAATGQRWGADILVDDQACATLAERLKSLASAGCHDVSLLGFVGEPARLLSPRSRRQLADIALASPLPCRVSVCFGSSLALPRLMAGFDNDDDCGAGRDFVTVTSSQHVQACSFQECGFAGDSASAILDAWQSQRAALRRPSPRTGCARAGIQAPTATPLPDVAIWQDFAGNNSGECILVAKFESVEDAQGYLEELLPGWQANQDRGEPFSSAWNDLFSRERVAGASMSSGGRTRPDELVQIGRSVLAVGYGVDDNFPELRALAWKRGARVLPSGIHLHEPTTLFGAVAGRDERDRDELVRRAEQGGFDAFAHGRTVFLHTSQETECDDRIAAEGKAILALAEGRPAAAEILCVAWTKQDLTDALKRLGDGRPTKQRLWIRFLSVAGGAGEARRLAETLTDQSVVLGADWLLVDPVAGRKRVAVLAYRRDAAVTALEAERVKVGGYFWRPYPPPVKGAKARKAPMPAGEVLRAALLGSGEVPGEAILKQLHDRNEALSVEFLSADPGRALKAMQDVASDLGLSFWPSLSDPQPVLAMLSRLRADLRVTTE